MSVLSLGWIESRFIQVLEFVDGVLGDGSVEASKAEVGKCLAACIALTTGIGLNHLQIDTLRHGSDQA